MGRISPRKNKNISIKNVVTLPATKKYTTETETFHTDLEIPLPVPHTTYTKTKRISKSRSKTKYTHSTHYAQEIVPKYHNNHRYDMKHKVIVYNTVNLT